MAQLKKAIGKKSLLLLSINAILGTGIFFLPAFGALHAGPASVISWLLMSVAAVFISFYFAELISIFPSSGGAYAYAKAAFGEFPAFIVGWLSWMVANVTIAMLVVGSIIYLFPAVSFLVKLALSAAFIIFFNAVSYRGIGASTKLVIFFGVMTIASLMLIIFPGLITINTSNFSPFFVAPVSAVFLATYFIAETFFGWETMTYLSEEIKDAQKRLPKMLVIATVLIAAISILVVVVSLGNAPWHEFGNQAAPLSYIAGKIGGQGFASIFTLIVFIPLIGTAASWIISSPRLLYSMSRSRALPEFFGRVHEKHSTPHNAIIFQTAAIILITLAALGQFQLLLFLLVPLVMILYSIVMLCVVKLRTDKPGMKRHFSAPFPKIGPLVIVVFNAFMLYTWMNEVADALPVFVLGIILILVGVPLYILIKLQTDEAFTEKFFDRVSFLWDRMFPIWYSRQDVAGVIKRLRLRQNSIVLDFGCGSGITTAAIAGKARSGTVVAVDISEKQLEHAVRRVRNLNLENVILVKERQLRFRRSSFDAMAAVGVLEYLDNPRRTMKKLVSYLKKGGSFSMLSFGKSLGIPPPDHLKDEESIKRIFSGLPVTLRIEKSRKKMTEYWHVWGTKK